MHDRRFMHDRNGPNDWVVDHLGSGNYAVHFRPLLTAMARPQPWLPLLPSLKGQYQPMAASAPPGLLNLPGADIARRPLAPCAESVAYEWVDTCPRASGARLTWLVRGTAW